MTKEYVKSSKKKENHTLQFDRQKKEKKNTGIYFNYSKETDS